MEIIPNWHPFLVHFTVALTLTAAGLYLAAFLLRGRAVATDLTLVARWNLWLAAASVIPTFAAGLQAYYTVAHDAPSHAAMTVHLKWAVATLVLLILAASLAWRDRIRPVGFGAALGVTVVLASGALAVTGYLGAENVYRHGLGVMSLPAAGDGDGHDHEHVPSPSTTTGAELDGHSHDTGDVLAGDDPAAVADLLTHALRDGDREAVFEVLAPDVLIFESGGVERSAEEYGGHHMPSDMAFLKAMEIERLSRSVSMKPEFATVSTRSRLKGRFRDSDVDINSTETLVLEKRDGHWLVTHIHWSSRPADGDH